MSLIKRSVEGLICRVDRAREYWKDDFARMRDNVDFVAGIQWDGQQKIRHSQYICNMTIQMVNQKVATLYAKNPTVKAQRRDRMYFQYWDEKVETLQEAMLRIQESAMSGVPDLEAITILQDYERGNRLRQAVDRVGRTLEVLYQHQLDTQSVDFKEQMKQLVTVAVVCGVAYSRINFIRNPMRALNAPQTSHGRTAAERMAAAQEIMERLRNGDISEEDPQVAVMQQLITSLNYPTDQMQETECLVVDFPDPTTVIPDPNTKSLNEFVGAQWVAQDYELPLSQVNAFFGTSVKYSGEIENEQTQREKEGKSEKKTEQEEEDKDPVVRFTEVVNIRTKDHCFVMKGHDDYLLPPEPLEPVTRRFWPWFPLTFNRTVSIANTKTTIFPPSDVDLVWHSQKEWNRVRDGLRAQRRANAPKYGTRKGLMTASDKLKLNSARPNEVLEFEGIPADSKPSDWIQPLNHAPIDPAAYDTNPLREDFMLASRVQEANMGPAEPHVTATVGTIAEQSRQTVAASHVDDLDGHLSRMAEAAGEILLREMPREKVVTIVGPGACWPSQDASRFVEEIYLQVVAASSGRPNKAMEIANMERLGQILLQAGANPQFIVRESVRRLDDRIDPAEAFPLVPTQQLAAPTDVPSEGNEAAAPNQPLVQLPSQAAVPLAGA